MDRKSLISGAREKAKFAKVQRENAMLAIKFNNAHSGSWDQLGLWHYRTSNLKGSDKASAGVFYGGSVKDASNDNAIRCFEIALQHDPEIIEYRYHLALVYAAINRNDLAVDQCNAALLLRPTRAGDTRLHAKCKALREELN